MTFRLHGNVSPFASLFASLLMVVGFAVSERIEGQEAGAAPAATSAPAAGTPAAKPGTSAPAPGTPAPAAGTTRTLGPGESISVGADGQTTTGMGAAPGENGSTEEAAAAAAPSSGSAALLPALLYPDTVSIIRINTKKIDYDMLDTFLKDFIYGAIGSLQSGDTYLNQLREDQKKEIIASVSDLFASMRTTFADELWANNVSEFYRIRYEEGGKFCQILAFPVSGDSTSLMGYVKDHYNPISCFVRFGFLIAVVDHTSATAEEEKQAALDLLTGVTGKKSDKKKASGEKKPDGEKDATANLTSQQKIRREVLPPLRKRFLNPAEGPVSAVEALTATEGAAVTVVMPNASSIGHWLDYLTENGLAFDFAPVKQLLESSDDVVEWATFNLSLVKSPRVIVLARMKQNKMAEQFSTIGKAALLGLQTTLNAKFEAQVQELSLPFEKNPFIDMLNPVFAAIKSESKGKDAALTLDLTVLKENANAFVPLFGGVPSAPPEKVLAPGEEDIDFGEDNALPDVIATPEESPTDEKPASEEETPSPSREKIDEDDPFA